MNTLQKIRKRIDSILEDRAQQYADLQIRMEEASEAITAAEDAMMIATAKLDEDSYKKAMQDRDSAQAQYSMYTARMTQLAKNESVSEAESDMVIDELLQFQADLRQNFEADLAIKLRELDEFRRKYYDQYEETESIIKEWCRDVHDNFRSFSGTIYGDTGTNRSTRPIPVHRAPDHGGLIHNLLWQTLSQWKDRGWWA